MFLKFTTYRIFKKNNKFIIAMGLNFVQISQNVISEMKLNQYQCYGLSTHLGGRDTTSRQG